jgi:hypothetical protein
MEVVGYRSPFYPPSRDYEESEAGIERLMKAVYGDIDPEEMADLKAQRLERIRVRQEKATKDAQKMLRQVNRPVCRRDMLTAMDTAIMARVSAFEKKSDMANAALLLATIICKNILTDGPLHEGD